MRRTSWVMWLAVVVLVAGRGVCQEDGPAATRGTLAPRLVIEVGASMEIERLTMTADGEMIAVVCYGAEGELTLWSAHTGKRVRTILPPMKKISAIAFSDDSASIVTAGTGGAIALWRVSDGKMLAHSRDYSNQRITDVVLLEGGSRLVCATDAFETFIVPRDAMALRDPLRGGLHLSVYAGGTRLANVLAGPFKENGGVRRRDANVLFFDVETRREIASVDTDMCRSIRVTEDGARLAVATHEGPIRVYDMKTLDLVAELRARTQVFADVFFLNDDVVFAPGSTCRLKVWRLPVGEPVRTWRLDLGDQYRNVSSVRGASTFEAASRCLVMGGLRGRVYLFDLPEELAAP